MSLRKEITFEDEICEHLAANGWLNAERDGALYARARALFPPDLIAWVQASQPQAWDALMRNHGGAAEGVLLDRVRKQIDDRGTLDVMRHGVEMIGLRRPLVLAQFKPAMGMNPDITARYGANRLRVVRQIRYSRQNENCLDLVLFLNGLPVATVELKSDFTQSVADAVDQYRFDGLPRPRGQAPEPLLSFPGGALVHFAVSNSEVAMTTKLEGPATRFLPFNLGDHGAKGNPPNPNGHPTSYLWEQVWARDAFRVYSMRQAIALLRQTRRHVDRNFEHRVGRFTQSITSSPFTGLAPAPARFSRPSACGVSARAARSAKYVSVRRAESFSATATLMSWFSATPSASASLRASSSSDG